jgi:heme exporter protein B
MPPSEPVLVATGLSRRFAYRRVLDDVALAVEPGQAVLLVGENGAGKTTLLRVLAGLLQASAGRVERRSPPGMVAHESMLYPALSARENLRFFARLQGMDGPDVDHALEQVGMTARADDRLGTFSRGMVQRVAIARALVHRPLLLLLDEPLSGLDDAAAAAVVRVLAALRSRGTAMLIVSHQPDLLRDVGTHIVRLSNGRLGPVEPLGGTRTPSAAPAVAAEPRAAPLWRTAWRIAAKDVAIEWRTRTAFASALVFAVLVLAVLFFSRDATAVSAGDVAPGALWVTFTFAAMLGLNRAFLIEREQRALDGILLAAAPPSAIFWGKFLANLAFVGAIEAMSLPLFVLFYDVPVWLRLPELILVIAMSTVAFVAVGTLLSAMAVRTRYAELLLPLLLLPFLVPPLVGGVQVTARLLEGRPLSDVGGWLRLIAGFDLAFVTLSASLFHVVLDE